MIHSTQPRESRFFGSRFFAMMTAILALLLSLLLLSLLQSIIASTMTKHEYLTPECNGKNCDIIDVPSSCVHIALEFVLEDTGEHVFVRNATWDGKGAQNGYFASFFYRGKDGSLYSLAAIPRYVLEWMEGNGKSPPQKSIEQVEQADFSPANKKVQAIADCVYCYGQTNYFSNTTYVKSDDFHRRRRFSGNNGAMSTPPIERYCVPEGVKVLDCLTEDHLRRIRYFEQNE